MRTSFRSGLASLTLLAAVAMLTGCQRAGYYAQAERGHLQIMHRQQPIAELLQQPQTPEPLKTPAPAGPGAAEIRGAGANPDISQVSWA